MDRYPCNINYQLSTVNYQLSTVNYQLSIINYLVVPPGIEPGSKV